SIMAYFGRVSIKSLDKSIGAILPSPVVVLPDLLERRHEFTDHCCTGRFSLFGRFHTGDVAGPAVVTSSSRTVSATADDHLFHDHGHNVPGAWCCGAFAGQPTHRHVFGDLTGSTSRPVCHGTWWGRYSHGDHWAIPHTAGNQTRAYHGDSVTRQGPKVSRFGSHTGTYRHPR